MDVIQRCAPTGGGGGGMGSIMSINILEKILKKL